MNPAETTNFLGDILVVDDVATNLRLLSHILKRHGYQVRPVTHGEFAIKAVQASPPDLILLDIMMPEIDGYQVCETLKSDPQTRDIPIIFLSALSDGADKAKAFQVGGADYITKPFQKEEVLARVANQLKQRQLQQQLQQQSELLREQNAQMQAEINDRKLLEGRLLSAEEKMRAVFEAMTDIVAVVEFQGGEIGNLDILPTNWVRLYDGEIDLVGQTIEQFFNPDTAESWRNVIQKVLESRETINLDYCLEMAEEIFWFAAAISPVREDAVIIVARDISDRFRAEEARRIAEERYHSIVENAIDGIFQSTADGRYLSVNPALAKIYGYPDPDALIHHIQNINSQLYVNPNRRQEFIEQINSNNSVTGFESMVYRQDGSIIWISETARAVRDSSGKILYYEGIVSDITERKFAQEAVKFQQAQTEKLLLNILPQPIANRLQDGENPIADRFDNVSVLFADLVGFTQFCSEQPPEKLVQLLNQIFSNFDKLAQQHGLEKIKTIGDAYMVVGGLPFPRDDAAIAIAQMALEMQSVLTTFNHHHSENFQLRLGIHTGPVIAGVIGMSKFIYDLWGDTVNIASRMESSGIPGKIQVTAPTYEQLKNTFTLEKRGIIPVKGKGEMLTYWLMNYLQN
ncbi:adenylate/guanylate cyclase domain-containing protein [Phormidium sp. CCY1219]|uniref:adenylate/guanylate cyclase domain-containing protein n=1 Tax=Phormidium sp. CCY1219 TaxID=2886104 RepID=UPI002D1ECD4A|nr:adenylate/guanylate cyclase domain-containing protein [Phormidium sp. CCY1219]MEB3829334.1 response regulator [Phormidium sp. CCY1219]